MRVGAAIRTQGFCVNKGRGIKATLFAVFELEIKLEIRPHFHRNNIKQHRSPHCKGAIRKGSSPLTARSQSTIKYRSVLDGYCCLISLISHMDMRNIMAAIEPAVCELIVVSALVW